MADARFEPVADGIKILDTGMAGQCELNAVYLIGSTQPTLVETGPASDAGVVLAALQMEGIGSADLAHIVVTHIHLDHSGGAGTLLQRFGSATVWVHERGAQHLADPTRLTASTARTYGQERMLRLFGRTEPVAPERLRTVVDGDRIGLGDRTLDVLHTPGHASHHVALVESVTGAVFTGEAVGSHLPWVDVYRPALPPPEVDVTAALDSIERIRLRASMLLTSHFGAIADPYEGCTRASDRIRSWAEAVRDALREGVIELDEMEGVLRSLASSEYFADSQTEIDYSRYDALGSIRMNAAGLTRYWTKLWEEQAAHPS